MTTSPPTEQQLTAAIYDALVDFQRMAQLSSLQHAQMRQHLAEHLAGALALRMGVVPSPAEIRADAFRELADRADPKRPEVSWFGDFGHQVGEWIRKQAEYEQNTAPAPASAPPAASHGPAGDRGGETGAEGAAGRVGDSGAQYIALTRSDLAVLLAHHADVIAARWRAVAPGAGAWEIAAALSLTSHANELSAEMERPAVAELLDNIWTFHPEQQTATEETAR